ncbi:YkvA family protein [Jeotgalibacillus sp. JSM ZJ347]|uniref:YkvA family protein n=1 Tax=Jeotgalibacillus sp. JSM ZJ347 TaxID=3342117 RepID=UPI0035A98C8C
MEQQTRKEQENFYFRLRNKMDDFLKSKTGKNHQYAKYLLFAPDVFYLLIQVVRDKRVSGKDKAMVAGAISYFVLPFDLIPEGLIGPGGYIDDLVVASFVLQTIVNSLSPEIIRDHWAGDEDGIKVINKIAGLSDKVLKKGTLPALLKKFQK